MSDNFTNLGHGQANEISFSLCSSFLIRYGMGCCSASGALVYKAQSQDEDALGQTGAQ